MKKPEPENLGAHSRRTFLKSLGTVAATAATAQDKSVAAELEKANAEKVIGPGAVPVTLNVNGQKLKLMLEPRVTLLDALRNYSSLTGSKEGCDRATCGACTVLVDDVPIYSCQKLAILSRTSDSARVILVLYRVEDGEENARNPSQCDSQGLGRDKSALAESLACTEVTDEEDSRLIAWTLRDGTGAGQTQSQDQEKSAMRHIGWWRERSRAGLTLIEMIMVCALIGIVAAVALPKFDINRYRGDRKSTR